MKIQPYTRKAFFSYIFDVTGCRVLHSFPISVPCAQIYFWSAICGLRSKYLMVANHHLQQILSAYFSHSSSSSLQYEKLLLFVYSKRDTKQITSYMASLFGDLKSARSERPHQELPKKLLHVEIDEVPR